MGTRHLTCVISKGKFKVANYGQWDGYPMGQGETIIDFIINKMNYEKFKTEVDKLVYFSEEEINQKWIECGADPKTDFVSIKVSDKFKIKYPYLNRDCGAEILNLIQENKVSGTHNSLKFALNTLCCEYMYIIDLDDKTLKIYTGKDISDFYSYNFSDLKSDSMKRLEEKINI